MMVSRRLEAQQKFFRWLTIAVFGVIVVRLIILQLLEAPLYRTEAALNQFRFLPVRAPGAISSTPRALSWHPTRSSTPSPSTCSRSTPASLTTPSTTWSPCCMTPTRISTPRISISCSTMPRQSGRSYEPVVIKQDVSMDVVERLEEHRQDVPGVQIGKEIVRNYPEGTVASHLLGYIGEISSDELKQHAGR